MRLQHGGAYRTDISSLRNQIRANGTNANIVVVTVSHPLTENEVDLHIKLSYSANSQVGGINSSLYTVAFGNHNGTWHFNINDRDIVLPGIALHASIDGSYKQFGHSGELPEITNTNLLGAINAVSNYNGGVGGYPSKGVLDGLTRLIISVNEAARFDEVERGIDSVLGNSKSYAPPSETIRSWGGQTIGS